MLKRFLFYRLMYVIVVVMALHFSFRSGWNILTMAARYERAFTQNLFKSKIPFNLKYLGIEKPKNHLL